MSGSFSDDAEAGVFTLRVGAFAVRGDYRWAGDVLTIVHVVADDALRGSGAAGRLMRHIVDTARAGRMRIKAECPYAASWLDRHPEHRDLLA